MKLYVGKRYFALIARQAFLSGGCGGAVSVNVVPGGIKHSRRVPAQASESTSMSNNGRTEALKLVVETRDWFRNEVEAGDEALVLWIRKLDTAIDLLSTED